MPTVLVFLAAGLRGFSIGLISVYLGIYLVHLKINPFWSSLVVGAGLLGNTFSALLISYFGLRIPRRFLFLFLSLLMAAGGFSLALTTSPKILIGMAFLGMVNSMGKDRGGLRAMDQTLLPELTDEKRRTYIFALYNVLIDVSQAVGAASAALPDLMAKTFKLSSPEIMAFGSYAFFVLFSGVIYGINPLTHLFPALSQKSVSISQESKSKIWNLTFLFTLDALGGGFLTSTLIVYWFLVRFHPSTSAIAILFFIARILNAGSNVIAAWLSKKIGLLNTMVFTHIPSSLFLIASALSPNFALAVFFFLLRESLVQMDVPTRESYTMAVIKPEERPFAAGLTSTARNLGWAITPPLGGSGMAWISPIFSLITGSSLKILYDILLFLKFRQIKPPEEVRKYPHSF